MSNTENTATMTTENTMNSSTSTGETLVVVSKVKKFIRDNSGMNTSKDFIDALTQKISQECFRGIEQARIAGRKTVMGRDLA